MHKTAHELSTTSQQLCQALDHEKGEAGQVLLGDTICVCVVLVPSHSVVSSSWRPSGL